MIVAAFQRAAVSARASLTSIQEKLVQTAETSKLSAEGIQAGFMGLSALTGAGILVGFAAHFLDETAKMEIELAHLQEKTNITIQGLAGLQQVVKESGGDWDAIATGLVKMEKALADANTPSKQLIEALGGINLKISDLKGLQADAQLAKIAAAFAATENAGNRAFAATTLFGRGGQALIPVLVTQGAALQANIEAASKLTGVTDASVNAAKAWQQTTARLSAEFRSVMVPTIEIVEKAIAGLWGVVMALDSALSTVDYTIRGLFRSATAGIGAFYNILYDAMTGNWGAIKRDAATAAHEVGQIWSEEGHKIARDWGNVGSLMTWHPKATTTVAASGDTDSGDESGAGSDSVGTGSESGSGSKRGSAASTPGLGGTNETYADMEQIRTESYDISASWLAQMQSIVKENQDAAKQMVEADRNAAEEKIRIAHEDYVDVEKNTEFEVRMGRMSAEQRLAVLRSAANQENQTRQQQSTFLEMLDLNDAKRYAADLKREEQDTRQWTRTIMQLNQQAALDTSKNWQQAYDKMTNAFSRNMAAWATGQETLARSWSKTLVGMTQTVIENLLKQSVAYATNAATQEAIDEREKLKDAAAAARKAFKAVVGIPIVGPILAPIAAGAAFAAVEAFEAGGIVGGSGGMGVPILAHAGERVLSQSQTTNFEKLINQSSSSSSSITNHFHDHSNFTGIDGASVESMYRKHAASGRREMMRQLRLANRI